MIVLVVDDHALVREGIAALLRQAWANSVILHAAKAETALELVAARHDIDLVLLDLMLPEHTGLDALAAFSRGSPGLPIVVLSSSESPTDVRRALGLGALGYVPKSAPPSTLMAALNLVLSGEIYVPSFMAEQLSTANGTGGPAGSVEGFSRLTDRQRDVLRLICAHAANKEIAYRLAISEKTVKTHVTAILKALRVASRADALRLVNQHHLI